MTLGRPLAPLELTESDREQLESMARSRSLPHGLVRRAEIVLLAAEGWPNEAVAAMVGVTRATVGKWRQRFLKSGLHGLYDELRSGAPRSITDEQVAEVVYKTLKTKPKDETQWSVRSMGEETGLSKDAVHRIWRTFGTKSAPAALGTGVRGRGYARLQAARHNDPVRGAGHRHGRSDDPV